MEQDKAGEKEEEQKEDAVQKEKENNKEETVVQKEEVNAVPKEEVKEVKSRRPRKKRVNPQDVKRSLSSPGGFEPESTSEEEEKRRRERRSSLSGEQEAEPAPRPTLRRNKAKKEVKKPEETTKEESTPNVNEEVVPEVEAEKKEEKEVREEEAPKEEEKTKEEEEPKKKNDSPPKEEVVTTNEPTKYKEWWKPPWSKWGHKKDSAALAKESKIIEIIPPEVVEEEKSGLRRRFAAAEKEEEAEEEVEETDELWKPEESKVPKKARTWKETVRELKKQYRKFTLDHPQDADLIRKLRNRCVNDLILIFIICGLGAFLFKTTEGSFESFYKCGVKRVKRDFIDELWRTSHYKREDEWKSLARKKLMDFENQLHEAFEAGMKSYSGQRSWSFLNALIYCFTVISTIGYGHIAPTTNTGRALTIIYAVFGIPMFLILLADFGKLFTRGIKWIWAFVRRVYYTGTCKKVRKTEPVQEVMKGVQVMYDMALFRRGSGQPAEGPQNSDQTPVSVEPPSTPAPSQFAIDDEFNIPITVALTILLLYIFGGACLFYVWEDSWSFFESFYFVFISMSTIGFGDFVPQNKMYMMGSIVYLAFGLALTSMCINVVQEKLSDTFRKATAKIGATIGLRVCQDDGTVTPATPAKVELAQVHNSHRS